MTTHDRERLHPQGSHEPKRGAQPSDLFRTKEVVQILGISRRQLQYWAQTDLVAPSVKTPGGHHRYSFSDLVALKTTKRLIDAGVSVQRIRESMRSLREILPKIEKPLSELVLVTTGDIVLVLLEGAVFEAVSGQEWVFEVSEFQSEVEAWKAAQRTDSGKPAGSTRTGQWSKTA